jgi:CRP-like cAMP-binding protein
VPPKKPVRTTPKVSPRSLSAKSLPAKSISKSLRVTAAGTPKRAASRPIPTPRPAKQLPGYPRLGSRGQIARGGMGVIHRAFDTRTERTLAIKVIDPEYAANPEMIARFFDEARITGQLDHPNIVPVHDVLVDDNGQPTAMVMKLVDGETLTARISNTPRRERELTKLLEIFLKICDAVAFAHSRGVIHRDLKPDNIMIGTFGQVYVMDWGCAHVIPKPRRLDEQEGRPRRTLSEAPGMVIGTPGYMAPEQAWGKTTEIDERTDVFGLGAILYHILTGTSPHPGDSTSATIGHARVTEPRPPQELAGDVRLPPGLCRIAMHAIATKPFERFASVEELRSEVEAFLRGGSYFDSRTFSAGTVIVKEGDVADVAYVITAGTCEAFRKERGRRITLRSLGPGDVFGEGAMFAAGTRNASVVAVDDVTVIVVSRETLHEELALDSWMGSFVRALAVRYRDLEARNRVQSAITDQLRVTQTIVEYLSRTGMWCGTSTLGSSWSRVWGALGGELRMTHDDVVDLVTRTPDLSLDLAADTITLSVPAPSDQ